MVLCQAGTAWAQADSIRVDVSWLPAVPVQGDFVRVIVLVDSVTAADTALKAFGQLGREPLHFVRDADSLVGLGGVPFNAGGALELRITLQLGDGTVKVTRGNMPVEPGDFPVDRLSVNPRFSHVPDSAALVRIRGERRQVIELARRAHRTPRLYRGRFLLPRHSRVTSGYGNVREFNGRIESRHLGVDFQGAEGEAVHAANRGVVAIVDRFYYGGNVVYVNHGAGMVTAYLHLSETHVAVGDTVEAGDVIGLVGATGRVTGPHLHWMARYGNLTLNALSLRKVGLLEFEPDSLAEGGPPAGR